MGGQPHVGRGTIWYSALRCHKTLHPVSRDASPTPFMSCEVPLGCHVIDFRSWAASSLRVSPFKPSRQAPVSYHVFRNRLSVTPRNRNRNHRILEFMHSILVWVSCHVDFRHGQSRAFVCQHLNPQDKLPSHVMSFEQLSVTPRNRKHVVLHVSGVTPRVASRCSSHEWHPLLFT